MISNLSQQSNLLLCQFSVFRSLNLLKHLNHIIHPIIRLHITKKQIIRCSIMMTIIPIAAVLVDAICFIKKNVVTFLPDTFSYS